MVIRTDRTTANYLRWNLGRIKHDGISECLCNLRHVFSLEHLVMIVMFSCFWLAMDQLRQDMSRLSKSASFCWGVTSNDAMFQSMACWSWWCRIYASQLCPIDTNWHQLTLEFSLGAWKHQPHQADAQSDVSDWELQTQCRAFDQHFSRCGCQVSTVGVVPDWSQCLEKANKKCTSKKSLNVVSMI